MKYTACLMRADPKHPHLGTPGYQYFFDSVAKADTYFTAQAPVKFETEVFPVPESVTLEIKPEDAYADPFTYIWFSGPEPKYSFGCYVSSYTPRNPNLTLFTLRFDPWASCAGLFGMNRCIVERNHLAWDPFNFDLSNFWEVTVPNLPAEPAPIQPVYMHGPSADSEVKNDFIREIFCRPNYVAPCSILQKIEWASTDPLVYQDMKSWRKSNMVESRQMTYVVYALKKFYDSATSTNLISEPIVAFALYQDGDNLYTYDQAPERQTIRDAQGGVTKGWETVQSPDAGFNGEGTIGQKNIYVSDFYHAMVTGKAIVRQSSNNIPLRFQTDSPDNIMWVSVIKTPTAYTGINRIYTEYPSDVEKRIILHASGRGSSTSGGAPVREGYFWRGNLHWSGSEGSCVNANRQMPGPQWSEHFMIRYTAMGENETPTRAMAEYKNRRYFLQYMNEMHDVTDIIKPRVDAKSMTTAGKPELLVGLQHRIFVSPMGIKHIISEGGKYCQLPTRNYFLAEKALKKTIEFMHPNLSTMAQREWASTGIQTAQQALQIGGNIVSGLSTILANRKDSTALGTTADLSSLAAGSVLSALAMEEANRGEPNVTSVGLTVPEAVGHLGFPCVWDYTAASTTYNPTLLSFIPSMPGQLIELTPTNMPAIMEIYDRFGVPINQMATPNIVPQSLSLPPGNESHGTYIKTAGTGCVYGVPQDIALQMDMQLQQGIYFIEPENQV